MKRDVRIDGWRRYDRSTYSAGVIAEGRQILFISGMTAIDVDSDEVHAPGDLKGQARVIYGKIGRVLKEVGADYRNIVRLRDYIVGEKLPEYWDVDGIRREFLKDNVIASTAIAVVGLAKPGLLIEIDAVAVLD